MIKKQINQKIDGLTYVLTDGSIDAESEVIDIATLNINRFVRNPVALAYHDSRWEVGRWKNLRFQDSKLLADLELIDDGVKSMVDKGLLNGASIGFILPDRNIEDTYIDNRSVRVLKNAEIVEASIVPIPSNPNALRVKTKQLLDEGLISKELYDKTEQYFSKAGAVLNKANRDALKKAMELIKAVLDSAENNDENSEKNILEQILGGNNGIN